MIISQIIGGLGNQMFQYAAGRALALRNGVPLALDVSGFVGYGLHQGFELSRVFGIQTDLATQDDVRRMLGWQSSPLVRRITSRKPFTLLFQNKFVVEPHFHYWEGINALNDDCYMSGYWQSEKYFNDQASQIRKDFTFQLPLSGKNVELAELIDKANAVSLHVRRGDYAKDAKTNAMHGLCSLEYYREAIQYVSERVVEPTFFVFSDDISWVKENLEIEFSCHFVSHNSGEESYNDMRLMSLCRHHVIANSSFSWWGAWLNPHHDKIVLAPSGWFADPRFDTKDIIPGGWIIL